MSVCAVLCVYVRGWFGSKTIWLIGTTWECCVCWFCRMVYHLCYLTGNERSLNRVSCGLFCFVLNRYLLCLRCFNMLSILHRKWANEHLCVEQWTQEYCSILCDILMVKLLHTVAKLTLFADTNVHYHSTFPFTTSSRTL